MKVTIGTTEISCDSVQRTITFYRTGTEKQLMISVDHNVMSDDYYIEAITGATNVTVVDFQSSSFVYAIDLDRTPSVSVRYDAGNTSAQIMLPIE